MVNSILQPVEQQPCSALALRGIGTSVPVSTTNTKLSQYWVRHVPPASGPVPPWPVTLSGGLR